MNDSILIYNSIFDLTLRKINIKNHSVPDICQFPKDNHQESFFYSNKGKLGINNTSIVYAYFYKDQIDFMDLEGKLITKAKRPRIRKTAPGLVTVMITAEKKSSKWRLPPVLCLICLTGFVR